MMGFEQRLASGQSWELPVARYLQKRVGGTILYTGELNRDGAPMLHTGGEDVLVPDILIQGTKRGSIYVEVKSKSKASYHRRSGAYQTGFDAHMFEHYERAQAITGTPVYVVFVHKDTGQVLWGSLTELAASIHHTGRSKGKRMHYWSLDSLRPLCNVRDLEK